MFEQCSGTRVSVYATFQKRYYAHEYDDRCLPGTDTVTCVRHAPRTLLPVYHTERCHETEGSDPS